VTAFGEDRKPAARPFPHTASGKIQKFALRDRYLASQEGSGAAR